MDADLEKLSIRPGKLDPKFDRNITSYYVVLPSDTKNFLIDPMTSDRYASWTVVGIGNKRQLQIKPGTKKVFTIEVTAEDGTIKEYKITANCLSPNDASLSELSVSFGEITPHFSNDVFHYIVDVPWYTSTVDITAQSPDKNTVISIPDAVNNSIELNYSETASEIIVVSPDKNITKKFFLKFRKQRMLYFVCPLFSEDRSVTTRFQCPACLNVTHAPKTISESSPEYLFCEQCLVAITRRYPFHPILHTPLFEDFMISVAESEYQLSKLTVSCPFHLLGCKEELRLPTFGEHVSRCSQKPVFVKDDKGKEEVAQGDRMMCRLCSRTIFEDEKEIHLKHLCVAKYGHGKFMHKVDVRAWEHALRQQYEDATTTEPEDNDVPHHQQAFSPAEAVQNLIAMTWKYSTAISLEPQNAKLHYKLGLVFEEIHLAKDVYGEQIKEDDNIVSAGDNDLGLIELGGDSANEEEVKAICEGRNVPPNATLAQQLKALDEEYHYLLDEGLSAKADYVQKLFAWKSKQISESEKNKSHGNDEETFMQKAFLKYLDASALEPSRYIYHLHVGRHLIIQKKYLDAIKRLQVALALKPLNIQTRFYLALALCLSRDQTRNEECITYFREGIDYIMLKIHQNSDGSEITNDSNMNMAGRFISNTNTLILEGMLQYAKLLNIYISDDEEQYFINKKIMTQVLHLVCTVGMDFLYNLYHLGDIARQIQVFILKAQYTIGTLINSDMSSKITLQKRVQELKQFWARLGSLMKSFTLPTNKETLELERRVCEEAVFVQPSSSLALCRLAENRLAFYDYDIKQKKNLREADAIFRLSITMEGRAPSMPTTATCIVEAPWYKEKLIKMYEKGLKSSKGETTESKKAPEKGKNSSLEKTSVAEGKEGTKSSGPANKGAKTVLKLVQGARRGTVTKSNPIAEKAVTKKSSCSKMTGKTASKENIKNTGKTDKGIDAEKQAGNTKVPGSVEKSSKESEAAKKSSEKESTEKVPTAAVLGLTTDEGDLEFNPPCYRARLGLARVLVRYHDKTFETEINGLYKEIINMAPYVHDAYIELGEILTKLDPMKAVDVYASYPFSRNTSLDDAFLHGEIVRLLLKAGHVNDPRLGTSMVMYGKALGFSVLEKYVTQLENKGQLLLLKRVYAAINEKSVDDPELMEFFKFKCWM